MAAWLSGGMGQFALKMLRILFLSAGEHAAFWEEAADC